MTPEVVLAITILWTATCAAALGFCLRGWVFARRAKAAVEPLDGLAEMQARRNLRVERIRVLCQVCGLAVGLLALGARAGYVAPVVVQLGSTPLLVAIALLLLLDSILDDRYRGAVDAEEARAVAAALAPVHGGKRRYDPPLPAVPPAEVNPDTHP